MRFPFSYLTDLRQHKGVIKAFGFHEFLVSSRLNSLAITDGHNLVSTPDSRESVCQQVGFQCKGQFYFLFTFLPASFSVNNASIVRTIFTITGSPFFLFQNIKTRVKRKAGIVARPVSDYNGCPGLPCSV